MKIDEIWNCDERFHNAGEESTAHLWGKVELHRRKQNRESPSFPGEYRFEKTVADWTPDCFITGGPVNRWIEFVAGSEQKYWEKTRAALQLGFVIHWVFYTEYRDKISDARSALAPDLQGPFRFGEYTPEDGLLDLGDPITYKNYEFHVEDIDEVTPDEILGYRPGAASVGKSKDGMWFDLGMFSITGYQYHLFANRQGSHFRTVAPGDPGYDVEIWPTKDGLKRLIDARAVKRLGPVG